MSNGDRRLSPPRARRGIIRHAELGTQTCPDDLVKVGEVEEDVSLLCRLYSMAVAQSALAPFTIKGFYLLTWGTALGTNVWNTLVRDLPRLCTPIPS